MVGLTDSHLTRYLSLRNLCFEIGTNIGYFLFLFVGESFFRFNVQAGSRVEVIDGTFDTTLQPIFVHLQIDIAPARFVGVQAVLQDAEVPVPGPPDNPPDT